MAKIEWDKKFEVGNIEIDSEHKTFVRIVQKIICAKEKKKEHKYIERLIYEIYKYADFHFFSEETVMIEIDYPDMQNHKKEHENLLLELRNMISIVGNTNLERPLDDFIKFLLSWFANHTVNVDKKLADYIKKARE